jgi:hypothetical protein
MNIATTPAGVVSLARSTDEEVAEVHNATIGAKFLRLRDLPRTLNAQANFFAEQEAEARAEAVAKTREEARILADITGRTQAAMLEPRIAGLRKDGARHSAAAERAGTEKLKLRDRASPASSLAGALRELLASTSPDAIRVVREPAVPKGWTVETARTELAKINGQIAATEAAPDTAASIRKRMFDAVDAIAARGAVQVRASSRDGDPARLAERLVLGIRGGSLVGDGGASLFVWLLQDQIKAKLEAMIPDLPHAMTADQRDQRLDQLRAEKLRVERIEEALISAAEAEGRTIDRRPDASPLAVLGIEIRGA